MTSASRAARPARRGLLALTTALAATVLALGPVPAAQAASTPTPDPATTGAVSLALSPAAGGVVRAGQPLSVTVALQNGTTTSTDAASVRLLVGETPFATRDEAAAWAASPGDRTLDQAGSTSIGAVAPAVRQAVTITVAATDAALSGRAAGVYPLLAVWGDGPSSRSAASTLVIPGAVSTAPVGVVVPITLPARTTGLASAAELTEATSADGSLTRQLDAVEGTGAILAVDPSIVASIRVLGDGAPATATAWLSRLESAPLSRFALQFGDADVAAQLHSGSGMLLQPLSFAAQLDPNRFPSSTVTGATTAPGADLPSQDELLDVGGSAGPAVYWPATGSADAAVLDRLAAIDADALALIPSDTTAAGAAGRVVAARGERTLVYDAPTSAAMAAASRLDDEVLRGAALARVAAQLAFTLPAAGGAPLLVTVDRAADRSSAALRAAIQAVTDTDGVVVDDLRGLEGATPASVEVTGGAPDAERAAAVDALVGDEPALARFATVVSDPLLITAPERAALLQVMGTAWVSDVAGWRTAYADHRAATVATLAAVSVPPPTDVNLLTASTRLQFVVRNTLPFPVTVTLVARPDDPRLVVQRETVVEASAGSDTRVVVPVEARVGNGDVSIALDLVSASGVEIGSTDSVDVRVRAEWEGFGVIGLAVLVVALLGVGILRTVLRRRRAARSLAAHGDGTDAAPPAAPAGADA